MNSLRRHPAKALALAAVLCGSTLGVAADTESKAVLELAGKDAVEARRATFNLIGKHFKPIGGILKGEVAFEAVAVGQLVERVVILTDFLHGTFPADSNLGDPTSKAKPELWAEKAEFERQLQQFKADTQQLAKVVTADNSNSAAFKEAANKVAQDCKGCHDKFKLK